MANTLGLATLSPEKAKDEDFLAALEAMAPDLCVTAAYGQYLPKRFLKIPRCGTLNIHPSLLPRWRGASPVQRSLEAGDRETGVSVLWTVSKMDAGNMAAQRRRGLDGHEKATELLDELFGLGTNELIGLLPKVWSGECTPETSTRQADEGVVAADKITVHEAQVSSPHSLRS
jgi:methionyl-tRNA formyltransferase